MTSSALSIRVCVPFFAMRESAAGPFATWRGTQPKAALGSGTDIIARLMAVQAGARRGLEEGHGRPAHAARPEPHGVRRQAHDLRRLRTDPGHLRLAGREDL